MASRVWLFDLDFSFRNSPEINADKTDWLEHIEYGVSQVMFQVILS